MAKPLLWRTARRIRKSPIACGTRMPEAMVWASSQRAACSVPFSKARTIGAQPAACTATIRGRPPRPGRGADESVGLEFAERLPHPDQTGAAAGRIEDHIRHVPTELFG